MQKFHIHVIYDVLYGFLPREIRLSVHKNNPQSSMDDMCFTCFLKSMPFFPPTDALYVRADDYATIINFPHFRKLNLTTLFS
jgi:hypothetical protein